MSMICVSCGCGCRILPNQCLIDANSRVKSFKAYEKPEIANDVNTFILIGKANDGLLGQNCFDALCAAIKEAQNEADDYREANPNYEQNDPLAEFWNYLPTIWYNLLKNYHFVNMYAAYMVYYYYKLGFADAETLLDGDVQHNRSSNVNQNDGTKNITLTDAEKKASVAGATARGHYDAFINNFWKANKGAYNCLPPAACEPMTNCIESRDGCGSNIKSRKRPRPTAF